MKPTAQAPAIPATQEENNNNVFGNIVANTLKRVMSGGSLNLGSIIGIAKEEVENNFDKLQLGTDEKPEAKKLTDGNS